MSSFPQTGAGNLGAPNPGMGGGGSGFVPPMSNAMANPMARPGSSRGFRPAPNPVKNPRMPQITPATTGGVAQLAQQAHEMNGQAAAPGLPGSPQTMGAGKIARDVEALLQRPGTHTAGTYDPAKQAYDAYIAGLSSPKAPDEGDNTGLEAGGAEGSSGHNLFDADKTASGGGLFTQALGKSLPAAPNLTFAEKLAGMPTPGQAMPADPSMGPMSTAISAPPPAAAAAPQAPPAGAPPAPAGAMPPDPAMAGAPASGGMAPPAAPGMPPAVDPATGQPLPPGAPAPQPGMGAPDPSANPAIGHQLDGLLQQGQQVDSMGEDMKYQKLVTAFLLENGFGKSAWQDNKGPRTSATGDTESVGYQIKDDHYDKGNEAWKNVGQYLKKAPKVQPDITKGRHKSAAGFLDQLQQYAKPVTDWASANPGTAGSIAGAAVGGGVGYLAGGGKGALIGAGVGGGVGGGLGAGYGMHRDALNAEADNASTAEWNKLTDNYPAWRKQWRQQNNNKVPGFIEEDDYVRKQVQPYSDRANNPLGMNAIKYRLGLDKGGSFKQADWRSALAKFIKSPATRTLGGAGLGVGAAQAENSMVFGDAVNPTMKKTNLLLGGVTGALMGNKDPKVRIGAAASWPLKQVGVGVGSGIMDAANASKDLASRQGELASTSLEAAKTNLEAQKNSVTAAKGMTDASARIGAAAESVAKPNPAADRLMGAGSDVLEGVKKWGPWALGGAAVAVPGMMLLNRWLKKRKPAQPKKPGTMPSRITLKQPGDYRITVDDMDQNAGSFSNTSHPGEGQLAKAAGGSRPEDSSWDDADDVEAAGMVRLFGHDVPDDAVQIFRTPDEARAWASHGRSKAASAAIQGAAPSAGNKLAKLVLKQVKGGKTKQAVNLAGTAKRMGMWGGGQGGGGQGGVTQPSQPSAPPQPAQAPSGAVTQPAGQPLPKLAGVVRRPIKPAPRRFKAVDPDDVLPVEAVEKVKEDTGREMPLTEMAVLKGRVKRAAVIRILARRVTKQASVNPHLAQRLRQMKANKAIKATLPAQDSMPSGDSEGDFKAAGFLGSAASMLARPFKAYGNHIREAAKDGVGAVTVGTHAMGAGAAGMAAYGLNQIQQDKAQAPQAQAQPAAPQQPQAAAQPPRPLQRPQMAAAR